MQLEMALTGSDFFHLIFQYDFLVLLLHLHTCWPENGSSPVQISPSALVVITFVLI